MGKSFVRYKGPNEHRECWANGCPIHDPDNYTGSKPPPGWDYRCLWKRQNRMYAESHGMVPVAVGKSHPLWIRFLNFIGRKFGL